MTCSGRQSLMYALSNHTFINRTDIDISIRWITDHETGFTAGDIRFFSFVEYRITGFTAGVPSNGRPDIPPIVFDTNDIDARYRRIIPSGVSAARVFSHKPRLGENMRVHQFQKLRLCDAGSGGQNRIESIETENISMSSTGRHRSAVSDSAEIIYPLHGSIFRRFNGINAFR